MSDQYQQYGEYQEYNNEGDGGYDQYNNDQMELQAEQDYQTKVQLDYFQAEELLRKNQLQKCLASLQQLYILSAQKQLKNWKVKILNFLLQIYCRSNSTPKIKQTLQRISQLNKKQKYTENAIKSIIMTIKSLPPNSFNQNKELVYEFICQLDNLGKIRSYLLFLQKAVDEDDSEEAQKLFTVIRRLLSQTKDVPASNLIELFSFQIRHSKKTKKNISKQIRKMQLKISSLQAESYMAEGHISIIKEAVAEILYLQENFKDCALYLCEAFQDNMKYGKNADLKKKLLKTNVLVALLSDQKEIYTIDKYNALYHQSASTFKGQNDIQCFYPMVQAFIENDLNQFISHSNAAFIYLDAPYQKLLDQVIKKLKMSKLLQIIHPYKNIKSSYLQKRLKSSAQEIQSMLFNLITDNKIRGRIRKQLAQTYLDIDQKKDEFINIQLENIKQISKRYL